MITTLTKNVLLASKGLKPVMVIGSGLGPYKALSSVAKKCGGPRVLISTVFGAGALAGASAGAIAGAIAGASVATIYTIHKLTFKKPAKQRFDVNFSVHTPNPINYATKDSFEKNTDEEGYRTCPVK